MKKSLLTLSLILAFATNAQATTRTLTCSNNAGNIKFGICGRYTGCPATITVGDVSKKYVFARTKDPTTGALTYSATRRPKCTVEISALRFGIRTATSVSCAKSLKGSKCVFSDS